MLRDGERVVKVLAADDSAVMREVMRTIFAMHEEAGERLPGRMELCGVARDGLEALELVKALQPDVLLLDLEMPRLDGLGVLKELRNVAPELPVILCSTYTERGARETLEGLAHGAKDYVTKPEHQRNYRAALDSLSQQLLPKIAGLAALAGLAGVAGRGYSAGLGRALKGGRAAAASGVAARAETAAVEVVVIGVSTGGPPALEALLPLLPGDFPVPVLVVQHMPKLFTGALAERLNRVCRLPVEEARDGVEITAGKVWLAAGDRNMEVALGTGGMGRARPRVLSLREEGPLHGCRPSVDMLFGSAAKVYGAGTMALVLTGMGSDGTQGARAVREAGGTVLAQDEASSAVWGMPARIVEEGLASEVLAPAGLARSLMERVRAGRGGGLAAEAAARREVIHGVL